MLIRALSTSETELCRALGALTVAAYTTLPGHVPEPGYEAELADVARRASMGDTEVLAALDGFRPLGGVTFVASTASPLAEHDDPEAASFRMLAVDPAASGRGVGEALVRACIERAKDIGRTNLAIHSTAWMADAHRLYGRLGFVRAEDLDWTPVPGIDLIGFRLEL